MSVRDLSLRDLTYLVTVAQLRHFGHAAAECHVSQPALSTQIRKIERILGTKIFERDRRQVFLTTTGETLVRQARKVLKEADHLGDLANTATNVLSGSFRLGLIATLGPYFVPYLLVPLRRQYPDLELVLTEDLTKSLIGHLMAGALDAAILALPLEEDRLESQSLFFEPFVLALPTGHPLCESEEIDISQIHRHEMILLTDGHCLKSQTLELCSHKETSAEQLQTASLETIRHLVACGAGYAVFPRLAVDDSMPELVTYRPFADREAGREMVMCWRRGFPGEKDVTGLIELISHHLPVGVRA